MDGILRSGANELIVYFHSPVKMARQILENSKLFKNESVGKLTGEYFAGCIRKAAYHFGVDGGARFVTSGIWRPVVLKAWDVATIEDFSVQQKSLDEPPSYARSGQQQSQYQGHELCQNHYWLRYKSSVTV